MSGIVSLAEGFRIQTAWAVNDYDFAVDGGAVSNIVLRGDKIPAGSYITDFKVIVLTALTGGAGATVALGAVAAGDLKAAGTLAAGGFNATGGKALDTTPVVGGNDTGLILSIAVNPLTAGKFKVITKFQRVL